MQCEYCGREQKIKRGVTCWRCGAPLRAPVVEKTENPEPYITRLNKFRLLYGMGYTGVKESPHVAYTTSSITDW